MSPRVSAAQLTSLLTDWRSLGGTGPLYVRLATAIRVLVLDARIPSSSLLPAERALATALGLSRTTVTAAYGQLREEGFVLSRQGGGSWVSLPGSRRRGATQWARGGADSSIIDLSRASPAGDPSVETAYHAALEQLGTYLAGTGYDPQGLLVLREAIARRYAARGAPTTPDQLLVTAGAQQAIDLLVRALVAPLDPVVVESPTYPNALDALRRARCRVLPVTVSPTGWDHQELTAVHRRSMPRLTYVIPDYQNPTGSRMDDMARASLVEAAVSSGTTLCVDETMTEISFDDVAPPAPMATFDQRVVSIGSMSKAYWAGLRVGWIRAESHLVLQLEEIKNAVDMASPPLEQLAAAWLLDNADDLVARHRATFAANRDGLVDALAHELGDWHFAIPRGGLSLWVQLHAPVSTSLAQAAFTHGLRLASGRRFGTDDRFERYVRIPYTLPRFWLEEAVRRLAAARRDVDAGWSAFPERVPMA
ncbi:MAG: PLP-dependent aminotransferase family protein [Acidimicrobiales bacterium]